MFWQQKFNKIENLLHNFTILYAVQYAKNRHLCVLTCKIVAKCCKMKRNFAKLGVSTLGISINKNTKNDNQNHFAHNQRHTLFLLIGTWQ